MPAMIREIQHSGKDAMSSLFSPEGGRDTVYLERNGVRSAPLKCNVLVPDTVLFYSFLDVEEGDKLIREVPRKEEIYTIRVVHFSRGLRNTPHYTLTLSKDSAIKDVPAPMSQVFNITGSHGIQIGNNNVQNFEIFVRDILSSIDQSGASPEVKDEAKGRLRAFLEHPLVSASFGAALPAIIGLLG